MKRRRAAEPSGIAGPTHTPPPSTRVGRPVSSSGLPPTAVGRAGGFPELGPGSFCVAGAGLFRDAHVFSLRVCVCLPVVPGALSATPGRLGPKQISVLRLDGFSSSHLFWFF